MRGAPLPSRGAQRGYARVGCLAWFRGWGAGLRVQGLGLMVQGLGFGVWGLGFGVWG